MEGVEYLLFSMVFDVTELLVEFKLELIDLSSGNGREHALQAMMNICPGILTEFHFRGGDTQLREVWIRRVQRGGSGLPPPGKPFFVIWLHPVHRKLQRSLCRVNMSIPPSPS